MAKERKTALGGPDEAKEVVVTLDRRLLGLIGLVLVFGGALAVGVWSAGRGGAQRTVQTAAGLRGPEADAVATAQMEAQLASVGLSKDTTTIIGDGQMIQSIDPAQAQPPSRPDAMLNPQDLSAGSADDVIKPVDDAEGIPDSMKDVPGGTQIEVNPNRPNTESWDHEVLANFPDPNVENKEFAPLRMEDVKGPLEGPRLAISDLNTLGTYDFGKSSMTDPVTHDFRATNAGDEDLLISRVYTGCGCTATRIEDVVLDAAGWVVDASGAKQPFVLKPGESAVFSVEFDPRNDGKPGAVAKYIQIYSNDPTKGMFDGSDPNSHETRFRIVIEPSYAFDPNAAAEDGG